MESNINLSDWQVEVVEDSHRYKVINCGRRAGKSFLVSWQMLYFATENPNSVVWFISPSYKQSKLIMWAMLGDLVPKEVIASKNETELVIKLINGSQIVLKGADNPDSLRGVHIDFCVFDETAFIKKWEFVWNVVRPTLIDSKADCWFISTPNGKNHFLDLYETKDPEWQSFHFTSYDNPYLDPHEIDKARQKMSDEQFAQEFLGEFMTMAGVFFREFKRETHVIPPYIPDRTNVIVGGLDWGYIDSFCVSFDEVTKIEFDDKTFYRSKTFCEIYGDHKDPKTWAREVIEKLKWFKLTLDDITWIMADTQLFNTLVDDPSKTIASLFFDVDDRYRSLLKPASKDRKSGWAIVHNWLSIAPDGLPYNQITENCVHGISEFNGAYHDDNDVEDISNDCTDHFLDQHRYKLKNLKWIDGGVGGVETNQSEGYRQPLVVQMEDGKQVGIDLDLWGESSASDRVITKR